MKIVNVMASSLDGRIGMHDREGDNERQNVGISSASDQAHLRAQIAKSDAILVGASSIRSNGECLDHPGSGGQYPVWYIYARFPLPESFGFWKQTHIPRVLVSSEPVPLVAGSGVTNLVFGKADPAQFLHQHLLKQNHRHALLFGGGVVNSWFYRQKLVDQLELTLAPVFVGRREAPFLLAPELERAVQFLLLSSHSSESFVFLSYSVVYP